MITFGLDISNHQGANPDLGQARRDGCELAILKAGEGSSYVDTTFGANLARARAAGMLVGAYWYQRADATARQHVDAISRVVPRDVPICIDVEASSGDITLTRQIIDGLRAAGWRVPLLYLPRWYWQQIGSPDLAGLPPLWSSRYPDMSAGPMVAKWGQVPDSYWGGYGGNTVALLQFTSSASIAGYGPLDANAFRGTRDELAALLGYGPVTPSASTHVANHEERTMLVPAGTNEHVVLPCAGAVPQFFYLYSAFGQKVTVHQCAFVMATPASGPDPEYVPGAGWDGADHVFDPNRPGPLPIPHHPDGRQPVGVVLRYTADHPFTAYVG